MSLVNQLLKPVKAVKKPIQNLTLATALFLSPFITGCGDSGSDSNNSTPVNHNPVIEAQANDNVLENSNFYRDVDASDADNDTLTYYLIDSPTGATIDSATGEINWTPNDSQSNASHNFTVGVGDGQGGTNEKSFSVYVTNVETANGNIKSYYTDINLQGIRVEFSDWSDSNVPVYTTWTDANGNWQLQDLPDHEYDVMIKDDNTGSENSGIRYETYCPRPFLVSKQKALEGKLTKNCRLFKQSDRQFINDVGRLNGDMRKWLQKPKFRIYLREYLSGNPVDSADITGVKDVIKTNLSQFCQGSFTFTDADIEEVDSTYAGEQDGYITVYWNDSTSQGHNISYFNGKEIIRSNSCFNTSVGKNVWLQELSENMIGTGETADTTYINSAFYATSSNTSYSQEDLIIGQSHYYTFNGEDLSRPAGNEDSFFSDAHDWDRGVTGNWNE